MPVQDVRDGEAGKMAKQARLILPIEQWPETDRHAWQQALSGEFVPGDADDVDDGLGSGEPAAQRYAGTVRPTTLHNSRKGYGRFLSVLAEAGRLDPDRPAGERVTRDIAAFYLEVLKQAGNSDQTCASRFLELRSALKILAPETDFAWLVTPGGRSIWSQAKPAIPKELAVEHATLLQWSRSLLASAQQRIPGWRRAVRYRNALILGVLTTRAPRLRSISLIRIGQHLLREQDRFRLVFGPADTKNAKRLEYDLPDWLCPHMSRYLDVERDFLLARGEEQEPPTDRLWIGQTGQPLAESGMGMLIFRLTGQQFQRRLGAHSFRAAITTAMAEADPANPGAAAALLGHSLEVSQAYYNKARVERAAKIHQADVATDRLRDRGLAKRHFRAKISS